ncbi:PP2C family serine/threonine-protein phosphatase [Gloeocapsa sp. PCC 73106]|uniref:PP2C family protein-serine/threonine phosphatase n=1 Tax=Gloeocapsa sp. PCC 73106 TaxID=102232 RepID=UPI0002D988D9|nr:protein phosphatase 2C domain-containing protein [Gloeocapsa sp. PCC 73106]
MRNTAAKVQCTNPSCQVFNLESENFCSKCRTPIIKRYLWAIAETVPDFQTGETLGDRYLVKQPRLFLDTKPAQNPECIDNIPDVLSPYFWLFPYRLHIPQVYGLLPNPSGSLIWLLEYNYLPLSQETLWSDAELLPPLTEIWKDASPLRQLNWLWQIAKLWHPLVKVKVAVSLLNPSLLRSRGQILQLQELDLSPQQTPELSELGKLWSDWIESSAPPIREFLTQLCQNLKNGKIQKIEQLLSILDQATYRWGQKQQKNYQIFSLTDPGPTREKNEDSCSPPPGTLLNHPPRVIVCDGLGGQEGGEIASQLAVESLEKHLTQLRFEDKSWRPKRNINQLDKIIHQANDQISERNDQEQRRERRRMGTTLLMGVAESHEIYLTHIGDSRIYLITKNGGYQITVDDDLASREVRLGYSTYRDALESPNSGALIQALGMGSSSSLHINRKRLILDEDCVFLFCSDGLSDFDRVEQYWESQILPVITQGINVATVAQQLLEIANEKNGHDNVTVALLYCQVSSDRDQQSLAWSEIQLPETIIPSEESEDISTSELTTQPMSEVRSQQNFPLKTSHESSAESLTSKNTSQFKPVVALLSLVILGSGGYWLWSRLYPRWNLNPASIPEQNQEFLKVGDIIKITQDVPVAKNKVLPSGSRLQILAIAPNQYRVRDISQPESTELITKADLKDNYQKIGFKAPSF